MQEKRMNPNNALWEKGDFTKIAQTMRQSAEAIIDRVGVTEGMKVLDLGCGDGNTAIPAAKRGAEVLGVDVASNLIAAAKKRAEEFRLSNISFQEGDASQLDGIGNDIFDLTISVFGAMFAPRPFDVAKEMVRVTRPGGRVVMGNWIPGDPTLIAQLLRISGSYSPPPPDGFISPITWGIEENVVERFGQAGVPPERISFDQDTYYFEYPGSPEEFVNVFSTYYGPTMNAFEAARSNGRESELRLELEALFASQNTMRSADSTSIPATFLRVTVNV
jgi:SAM-dependent methyltransferase